MIDEGQSGRPPSRDAAIRLDPALGIREEAEFFGDGRDRLFGIRYVPEAGDPWIGIIFCEPILSQFRAHYRTGVLTARALAGAGIAVQRFQYRGMGNSDGQITDLTLASMVEDVETATNRLTETTGLEAVGHLGVNVGAYPAGVVSRSGSPLILDSPPLSGRQYFRAAFRAHSIYAMKEGAERPASQELLEDLQTSGLTSLLGCRLPIGLYESLSEATLEGELGDDRRPVLLITPGKPDRPRVDITRLVDGLTAKGMEVDHLFRPKEDPLWYVDKDAPEDRPETRERAGAMANWLAARVIMSGEVDDG